MIEAHVLAGTASAIGALAAGLMYLLDVRRGLTKPHIFSWLIWGLINGIASVVAFVGDAMMSSISLAAASAACFLVCLFTIKQGEKNITRSDWAAFLSALVIIPIWVLSKEPLIAAILISVIDVLGFCPTFRKAWKKPHEENLRGFAFYSLTWFLGILAVMPFTLVTGLYPLVPFCTNTLLVIMLVLRRRALSEKGVCV